MEKVILLNFSQADCDRLAANTGLTVHRGYMQCNVGTYADDKDADPNFYCPDALYEYAAIFINLNEPDAISDDFDNKMKLWQERDKINLFNYWSKNKGVVTFFLGKNSFSSLRGLGIPVSLEEADSSDKKLVTWKFKYQTSFRQYVDKLSTKTKLPPQKYINFFKEFDKTSDMTVRHKIGNANSDTIGAYLDGVSGYADEDNPMFMLWPQFKNNLQIVEDLIKELDQFTNLFPSLKSQDWKLDTAHYPTRLKDYDSKLEDLKTTYEKNVQDLIKEKEDLREQYSHLVGLLTNQDDDLVDDVVWALSDILGIAVTNSDKFLKTRVKKEDLALVLGSKNVLVEVKGTVSQNPSPAYVSQLLTHVALNKKADVEVAGCMLIVNHDRESDPNKRSLPYSNDLEGLIVDITYLDTRVLHAITLGIIEGNLSKKEAVRLLSQPGRVVYPPKNKA